MVRGTFQRFWRDRRGGVLLAFGMALPILLGGTAAAVEYGSLFKRRSQLQRAADTAAIAAAQELVLVNSNDGQVSAVARSVALAAAETPPDRQTTVASRVLDNRAAVQVMLTETVPSLMGRLLSLPSTTIDVSATGRLSGSRKLCMLALDPKRPKVLALEKNAEITANGCAIYSNSTDKDGMSGADSATVAASFICSAGGFSGRNTQFSPIPTTDCPAIPDPLASRKRPFSSPICIDLSSALGALGKSGKTGNEIHSSRTLSPGTYCGGLHITDNAQVTLEPGIYVIQNGPLIVDKTASLTGQNVGFYFTGDKGGLRFDPNTTISLTAPKDGDMAGLLFFEDRTVSLPIPPPPGPKGLPPPPPLGSPPMREYRIISDNARMMLGTIYLPAGRLIVDSNRPVADRSAYTVIVARQIDLFDGPNLYLNTDYGATDVPVPEGVGPLKGTVSLAQ